MQTKYDIGQRVRVTDAARKEHGISGSVESVWAHDGIVEYLVRSDVGLRFWVRETQVEPVVIPKPGDRVRVTYEGVVKAAGGGRGLYVQVDGDDHSTWVRKEHCEVIE